MVKVKKESGVKKETVECEKGVFDEVVERLGDLHGMPERSANRSVLSSLIRTMLSQNTTVRIFQSEFTLISSIKSTFILHICLHVFTLYI